MKIFLLILFLVISLPKAIMAEKVIVFDFTDEEYKTLKVKKVKGEIKWTLGSNENGNFIRAEAEGKGSGLGKEVEVDI